MAFSGWLMAVGGLRYAALNARVRRNFGVKIAALTGPPFAALVLAGCTLLTGPDLSGVAGGYALELVDGARLPVAYESGSCPREIYRGEMGLSPRIHDTVPLYTILVNLRLSCDSAKVIFPVELREAVRDFGRWTIRGDFVELDSGKGYGEIRSRVIPGDAPVGPVLTLLLDGRQYTFRRSRKHE